VSQVILAQCTVDLCHYWALHSRSLSLLILAQSIHVTFDPCTVDPCHYWSLHSWSLSLLILAQVIPIAIDPRSSWSIHRLNWSLTQLIHVSNEPILTYWDRSINQITCTDEPLQGDPIEKVRGQRAYIYGIGARTARCVSGLTLLMGPIVMGI